MASSHTVILRGPFTAEDIRQIVDVAQMIESARPDETFEVFIDAPELDGEPERLMQQFNPLRPGYARTITSYKHD